MVTPSPVLAPEESSMLNTPSETESARAGRRGDASPAELEKLTAHAAALRRSGETRLAARTFVRIAELLPHSWLAQYNAGAVCLEAGELSESIDRLTASVELQPAASSLNLCAHVLALRGDMLAAKAAYERAAELEPRNFAAHWGLFEVLQLLADNAGAVHHQRLALAEKSLLSIEATRLPAQLSILELCVAGTFVANIPLDFIVDRERFTVHKLYLGEHPIPELPPYDVVVNTIAQGPSAGAALTAAAWFCAGQDRPVFNAPALVDLTSRHRVAERFAESRRVAVSAAVKASRMDVAARQPAFPFLIRPLDSHAGQGLAKIDDRAALVRYLLDTSQAEEFYVAPFVDYRNADGYYRKYRIVFVDGVPYPVHLAISPDWMIHYYNAPMAEHAWMRDEEHAFMRDIDSVFGAQRACGLREIAQAFPLEYFGIDCSVAADGRILLFEASTAMIVHMRDPVDLYPYKAQYIARIVDALERMLGRGGAGAPP